MKHIDLDTEEYRQRINEYRSDPMHKQFTDMLGEVLMRQAQQNAPYPKEIQDIVIPYEKSLVLITGIMAQYKAYIFCKYSDIISSENETT
jgi:hypothetical protein